MNPIDFFDNLRFWGGKRNKILDHFKIYGISNKIVELIANFYLPIYFSVTKNKKKYSLTKSTEKKDVIVSLTSFPKRLPTLYLVIESLLRQSIKPDKIILYLTESQVSDIEKLPKKLLAQRKRGLEIRLCPDEIRSHTKYYYAFKEFPESIVITVDDDLFYKSDLIETHLNNAKKYPNTIIANWVKEIIPGKYKYTEWPDLTYTPILSKNLLILGVSSVLYPPYSVHNDIFNVDNIKDLTLTADDIWLTAMILKKGTSVFYSAYKFNHLPIRIKNNETLISVNYERNQKCIDNINGFYQSTGEQRPFIDIPFKNQNE